MRRTHNEIRELIEKSVLDTRLARAIVRKSGIRLGGEADSYARGFRAYWDASMYGNYPDIELTETNYWHTVNMKEWSDAGGWYNPPYWTPPAGMYWVQFQMTFQLPPARSPNELEVYVLADTAAEPLRTIQGNQAWAYPLIDSPNYYRFETSHVYFSNRNDLRFSPYIRLEAFAPAMTLGTEPGGGQAVFTSTFVGTYLGPLPADTYLLE